MNYELMLAFRLRRRAFRYIFARSHRSQIPSPLPFPEPKSRPRAPLAKDAAPIPNAVFKSTSQRVYKSTSYCYNKICSDTLNVTIETLNYDDDLLSCCLRDSVTILGRHYELRSSYLPIFCRP